MTVMPFLCRLNGRAKQDFVFSLSLRPDPVTVFAPGGLFAMPGIH